MQISTQNARPDTPTAQLIVGMLASGDHVSDLIFSPGRPPQIESKGELVELPFQGFERLTGAQTMAIAEDLIGTNTNAVEQLKRDGSADVSYELHGVARRALARRVGRPLDHGRSFSFVRSDGKTGRSGDGLSGET